MIGCRSEMDVERKLRVLSQVATTRDEGNVVDEVAIHDVEMQPIGAASSARWIRFEVREVGGEEAGARGLWWRHGRSERMNVSQAGYNWKRWDVRGVEG